MRKIGTLVVCIVIMMSCLSCAFAQSADAADGDLNSYLKGSFTKSYNVYSGPGENYYRVNSSKYGSGGCRIWGTEGDWLLIGYGGSNNSYHVGYISKSALKNVKNLSGEVPELRLTNISAKVISDGCLVSDDPVLDNPRFTWLKGNTKVTLLGQYEGWRFIEFTLDKKPCRGWVRHFWLTDLSENEPTKVPTVKPTKAPTASPTKSPVTAAPVTSVPITAAPVTSVPVVTATPAPSGTESLLRSLSHNCPNTGIMLPGGFSPSQTSYILTVASWVSRVKFTPTAYDSNAVITVNGQKVSSGSESQIIQMTDDPQQVTIKVRGVNGTETQYTVFLQRRPSTARTRVSVGYISEIYQNNGTWFIGADLVEVSYLSSDYSTGTRATFVNNSSYIYRYAVNVHCDFWVGSPSNAQQAKDIETFRNTYQSTPDQLYTIVYLNDEIVSVVPYSGGSIGNAPVFYGDDGVG